TQFGDPEGDPLTIKGVHKSGYPSADLHRVFQGEEEKFRVEVHYMAGENTLVVVRDPDQKILKVIETDVRADISQRRRRPGSAPLKSHEINRIETWDGKPRLSLSQTTSDEGSTTTSTKYVSLEEFLQKQEQRFEYVVDEQKDLKVVGLHNEKAGTEEHRLMKGDTELLRLEAKLVGEKDLECKLVDPKGELLEGPWKTGVMPGDEIGIIVDGQRRFMFIDNGGKIIDASLHITNEDGSEASRFERNISEHVDSQTKKIQAAGSTQQTSGKGLPERAQRPEGEGPWKFEYKVGDLTVKVVHDPDEEREDHTLCLGEQELLVLRASCLKKKIWQKTTDVEVFDPSDKEMKSRLTLGASWKDLDRDGGQWMRLVEKDGRYNAAVFTKTAEGEVVLDPVIYEVKDLLDLTPYIEKAKAKSSRLEGVPPPIDLETGKKSSYQVKAGEAGAEVTFDVQVAQQQDENGGLREAHCISRMGEELLRVEVRDQDEAARKANIIIRGPGGEKALKIMDVGYDYKREGHGFEAGKPMLNIKYGRGKLSFDLLLPKGGIEMESWEDLREYFPKDWNKPKRLDPATLPPRPDESHRTRPQTPPQSQRPRRLGGGPPNID
ncbi:MAG: hypothetical protein ABH950_08830, partial [Candidatus Altiarchaeota archaeon]